MLCVFDASVGPTPAPPFDRVHEWLCVLCDYTFRRHEAPAASGSHGLNDSPTVPCAQVLMFQDRELFL